MESELASNAIRRAATGYLRNGSDCYTYALSLIWTRTRVLPNQTMAVLDDLRLGCVYHSGWFTALTCSNTKDRWLLDQRRRMEVRHLSDKELELFRRDYQDKEREIQRYIGVYLSGLVLVTGWIVGPQSRPLLTMALGNDGYNIYAFLIFVVLNIVFTNFLIYKSIIIHEITQFMTVVAKNDSGFLYWDSWRRSPQSATRPVRAVYTVTLSVLPIAVSFLIMFGVWNLLRADTNVLANRLSAFETATFAAEGSRSRDDNASARNPADSQSATAEQLAMVFSSAKVWFWIVLTLHLIPFTFFYVNVVPTNKRWGKILRLRKTGAMFKTLEEPTVNTAIEEPSQKGFRLILAHTGHPIGKITDEQLDLLLMNLQNESENDQSYYLDDRTIEMLEQQGADAQLRQMLRKAIGKKSGVEIRWEKIRD
jgi:hypothetical protein